jgi:hypothetical protein
MTNVSLLGISSSEVKKSGFFYVSRPAYGGNNAGTDNSTVFFHGPRTILSRLTTATAASGQILQWAPPAVNSSYNINFTGPYVQCEPANAMIQNLIDTAYKLSMTNLNNSAVADHFDYFAYVPNLTDDGVFGAASLDSSESSNQLWMLFSQNGTGWTTDPYPRCPNVVHQVCRLYDASYSLEVNFTNGNMAVQYEIGQEMDEVSYPSGIIDADEPLERKRMAYSAYMAAFTNLLTGSLGFYFESVTDANDFTYETNFTSISTNIQNTALLGSADLDCFFALDWMYQGVDWRAPSLQRKLDVDFAGNRTLDELIPELSANITISLMTDPLLA